MAADDGAPRGYVQPNGTTFAERWPHLDPDQFVNWVRHPCSCETAFDVARWGSKSLRQCAGHATLQEELMSAAPPPVAEGAAPLTAVLRGWIEEYHGCPYEQIAAHEVVAWANRKTTSKAQFDALLGVLHGC